MSLSVILCLFMIALLLWRYNKVDKENIEMKHFLGLSCGDKFEDKREWLIERQNRESGNELPTNKS